MGARPKPHLSVMCAKPFLATNACLSSASFISLSCPPLLFNPLLKHFSLFFFLFTFNFFPILLFFLFRLFLSPLKHLFESSALLSTVSSSSLFPTHKQKSKKKILAHTPQTPVTEKESRGEKGRERSWRKQTQDEHRAQNGRNQRTTTLSVVRHRRCFKLRIRLLVTIGSLVA